MEDNKRRTLELDNSHIRVIPLELLHGHVTLYREIHVCRLPDGLPDAVLVLLERRVPRFGSIEIQYGTVIRVTSIRADLIDDHFKDVRK